MLDQLSNSELAGEMHRLEHRLGQLSIWIGDCDREICNMIAENRQNQATIAQKMDLLHDAQVERYVVLSDLKKIELEMDRRVQGVVSNG